VLEGVSYFSVSVGIFQEQFKLLPFLASSSSAGYIYSIIVPCSAMWRRVPWYQSVTPKGDTAAPSHSQTR